MMKLPITLSFYIGRQFLFSCIIVLSVFLTLLAVIDAMELIRRSYGKEMPVGVMMEMVLLKLPYLAQELIPFIVLLGGILAFSRLTRTSELVVARAAGISVWQFLMPAIVVSFVLGVFLVTVFNPLSSVMLKRYEQLENKYLRGDTSMMTVSESGLWLRQKNGESGGKTVIYASSVSQEDMSLHDVTVFVFADQDVFIQRIDAEHAILKDGYWKLENASITAPDKMAEKHAYYFIKTTIRQNQIQESFASPETLSFWELPSFIKTLKASGFSALRHRLYWHSVLSVPIFLCAMVYIAAAFSLTPPRKGKTGMLIVGGIGVGFFIHFTSGLVSALGIAGSIPIMLAAWAPVVISMLLGIVLMLHLEDG